MKTNRDVLLGASLFAPILLGAIGQMIVGRYDWLLGRRILFYGTIGEVLLLVLLGLAVVGLGGMTVVRRYWAGGLPSTFGFRPRKELHGAAAVVVGISFVLLGLGLAAASGHMVYLLAKAGRTLEFL